MQYSILFESITDSDFPAGYFYAHIPALDLTTHSQGIEGAKAAASDLIVLWIEEKRAHGEAVPGDIPNGTFRKILKQAGLTKERVRSPVSSILRAVLVGQRSVW